MNTTGSVIAYFNGDFMPLDRVHISPWDRGFLFGDGVYEVIPVYNGRLFGLAGHLRRLTDSLAAIQLDNGLNPAHWEPMLRELVDRNGGGELALYLQVTRGAPTLRDHGFPATVSPTVFAMANPPKPLPPSLYSRGMTVVTLPDIRWGACHIKSIALLANILARQQALERGADDALLVRDGILTEGAASNLFLVQEDILYTPLKDHRILPGITRDIILELVAANGIPSREQDLPVECLKTADEIWFTSSTKEIVPVTRVDDRPVGTGVPGPLWERVMDLYQTHKREVCVAASPDV